MFDFRLRHRARLENKLSTTHSIVVFSQPLGLGQDAAHFQRLVEPHPTTLCPAHVRGSDSVVDDISSVNGEALVDVLSVQAPCFPTLY